MIAPGDEPKGGRADYTQEGAIGSDTQDRLGDLIDGSSDKDMRKKLAE